MTATIKIKMDNAAFEPANGVELARILTKLVSWIEGDNLTSGNGVTLFDINGNTVGKLTVTQ